MVAPRFVLLLALSSISFSGCAASLQDIHYSVVNKSRAEYAWLTNTSAGERWNYGSDYACGYKSGYYDASTGKGCVLPAVPPPCYWSTKYQTCEGQKHIQDWYRGYQCGVAAAQGSGYPSFHTVPIGPQAPVINKDGCGMCYAPPCCLCENGAQAATSTAAQQPGMPEEGLAAKQVMPVSQASAPHSDLALGLIGPAGLSCSPHSDKPIVRTASAEQPTIADAVIR